MRRSKATTRFVLSVRGKTTGGAGASEEVKPIIIEYIFTDVTRGALILATCKRVFVTKSIDSESIDEAANTGGYNRDGKG